MKKTSVVSVVIVILGLAAWLVLSERAEQPSAGEASPVDAVVSTASDGESPVRTDATGTIASTERGETAVSAEGAEPDEEKEPPKTPEELREAAEEAAVESFDNLTDKWMEPSEKGVTMADVDAFVAEFRKVPKDRQEECLQRALNLVPDENVMLLAGVLMDKSQPKEFVELVFNDVLNRDEDVKKPILQQIFKDKSHACWADTAWILDVTGETPAAAK